MSWLVRGDGSDGLENGDAPRARGGHALPKWATQGAGPVSIEDMKLLIGETRRLMPDVGIQIPPNLADWWSELVAAGATDLGGLSANGDHISPEHPFPSPHQVRKRLQADGFALTERLCVYPQYIDPEWVAQGVLDTIKLKYWSFIPRRGSGRTDPPAPIRPELVSGAIEKGRDGLPLSAEELTAMFAETRPEAIEDMRVAADELRAELAGDTVTFVVNRNINISNVCTVGCAFCGFGQGKRSPDAYQHDEAEFVRRVHEAIDYGASELCIQSGIHPDWELEDYLGWLRLAKSTSREAGSELHLHAYSPMEIAHMCDISGLPPSEVFAQLRDAGLDSTPGTAAEVLARRRARAHLPEQAARRALGGDHRSLPRGRPALDLDGHVRPHRGAVGARRAHARHPRAAGTHRRYHRVRAALVHPVPDSARAHARGGGDLA